MVIDFSTIDFSEQPVLVLQNADGTALQTLGYAFNLSGEFNYNEISTISFDIPAYVDGVKTPGYDDVIGLRMIDMVGWGRFVLVNPKVSGDGIKEIKSCKAYSLEYELVRKKMSLQNRPYNFWDPAAPAETVIGIILSYLPSWSVGEIDASLEGKYRTFEVSNANIYDFIKSTLQKTYGCVFDFDTYNRRINVKSVESEVTQAPVYISLQNLAKQIDVSEDTESIVTVLDVNGADGVTIRSVNPTGTNKIYDLDYLVETRQLPDDIVPVWEAWANAFAEHQSEYYELSMQKILKTSEVTACEYELLVMESEELATLEVERSVLIEYVATHTNTLETAAELARMSDAIRLKKAEIETKKGELDALKGAESAIQARLKAINDSLDFIAGTFYRGGAFTQSQFEVLDRYFIEDSIEDSSFVVSTAESYSGENLNFTVENSTITFRNDNGEMNVEETVISDGNVIYQIRGGVFECMSGSMQAKNIRSCVEAREQTNGTFKYVLSGSFGSGFIRSGSEVKEFEDGCIVSSGTSRNVTVYLTGSAGETLTFDECVLSGSTGRIFFTRDTSAYEQHEVEWELYEYGAQCLDKLSRPSYSFDVSTANFFSLEEFNSFARKTMLGHRMYLELGEDDVLQPVLLSVQLDFEKPSSLKLEFGDKFTRTGGAADLVDLLEQSVSMGKTVDTSRFSYNSFIDSGASTAVREYMNSALDASKNAILSGSNMAVSWDASGIHCRKYGADGVSYEPEELAIINNNIVFTTDNWQTAKMAIGKVIDPNLISASNTTGESWGIVADHIVGTLLAGENLVIESVKKDGSNAVFKVDADGAVLYNSKFEIANSKRHILIDPDIGLALGRKSLIKSDGTLNEDNAMFWVDTDGNVHFKGTLEGANGTFLGELKAATGSFSGELQAATGTFSGELKAATGTFSGELKAATGTFSGTLSAASGSFSGDITGSSGIFSGIVRASDFQTPDGKSMIKNGKFASDYLDLGNIVIDGESGNITFSPGGSIVLPDGSISSSMFDTNLNNKFTQVTTDAANAKSDANKAAGSAENAATSANSAATSANSAATSANSAATSASNAAGSASSAAESARVALAQVNSAAQAADDAASAAERTEASIKTLADGGYQGGTFINGRGIITPVLYASQNDLTTYGSFNDNGLYFTYQGIEKITLDYAGADQTTKHRAQLKLGQDTPGYVRKYHNGSAHILWVGDASESTGMKIDMTNGKVSFSGTIEGITTALATTQKAGLLRALNGNASYFLNGNGEWASVRQVPTLNNDATYFLNGTGSWSQVRQLPTLPNDAAKFLNGAGNWATPTVTAVFG